MDVYLINVYVQAPLILLTESPNGLSPYFGSFQDPI